MKQSIIIVGPCVSETELAKLATDAVAGRNILSHSFSTSTMPIQERSVLREYFRMSLVVEEKE